MAGIPLMLHIGDIGAPHLEATPAQLTSEALNLLDEGDILTHVFCPLSGGGLDAKGQLLPALRAAYDRGVVMDAAIGDYQFSWDAAEKVLGQGILPQVISSDAEIRPGSSGKSDIMVQNGRTTGERVESEITLVEYMAYFFELGFDLPEIIRMCTSAPARAAGIDNQAGDLSAGKPADISILSLESGHFRPTDVTGASRIGSKAITPFLTLRHGRPYKPNSGPHSWGFTPPPAA